MNPITHFLSEKLQLKLYKKPQEMRIPDLSSPANLSLTQVILLEDANDRSSISNLITRSEIKTVSGNLENKLEGNSNSSLENHLENNLEVIEETHPEASIQPQMQIEIVPPHDPEDLWIGPIN